MTVPLAAATALKNEDLALIRLPPKYTILRSLDESNSRESCCAVDCKKLDPHFFELGFCLSNL